MNKLQWWAKDATKQEQEIINKKEQEKETQKLYKDYGFGANDKEFLSYTEDLIYSSWSSEKLIKKIHYAIDYMLGSNGFIIYCAMHDDIYREFLKAISCTNYWISKKSIYEDYFVDMVKKIKDRYNQLWSSESMKLATLVKEFGHKDKKDEISDKASSSIFENLSK